MHLKCIQRQFKSVLMYAESKYYGIYRSIVYYRSIKRENLKFFAGRAEI